MKIGLYTLLLALAYTSAFCSSATPANPTTAPDSATRTTQPSVPPTLADEQLVSPVEFVWSINGEPNPINAPADLAVDLQDHLYVVDAGNDRIQVFDPDGNFVQMWGETGSGKGEFNFLRAGIPLGGETLGAGDMIGSVAVDLEGNVYVADNGNQRIQKFDKSGKFLLEWGSNGTDDGQFLSPYGVAVDPEGYVYVIDDFREDIQKFDSDGAFLLKWGRHGSNDGQFNYPADLAIDSQGNVYVADFSNHRVQKFDSQGIFLAKWGSLGAGPGQFSSPNGITIDAQGTLYVAEYAYKPPFTHRVQIFDSVGNFLGSWGRLGENNGEFTNPLAVAVDSQGNIYVSDVTNRIQKFKQR